MPSKVELLNIINERTHRMAIDVGKLLAVTARLEADDTAAVAALQALRDENKTTAAQLATVSAQLAALQAAGGGDTAAVQASIDDIVSRLGSTADAVEAGVASNPAVANLPPADAAPPAPAADASTTATAAAPAA